MPRSTGLDLRRSHIIDADTVLVGAVRAGYNRAAELRTGAARLLSTALNMNHHFKAVIHGHSSAATGGYLLEVAHVPVNKLVADALGWVSMGAISIVGEDVDELIISGAAIFKALRAAIDKRVGSFKTLVAGSGYTGAGTYTNVALTGGTGTGCTADIVVAGGSITTVTLKNPGKGFTVEDVLTTANTNLGGAGTGFSIRVATVLTQDEIRGCAVRATAGNGSNGASAPSAAGSITICLGPTLGA